MLVATAAWQLGIDTRALEGSLRAASWLHGVAFAGACVAAAVLATIARRRAPARLATAALGAGVVALLVVPAAWALSSVLVPGNGVLPSADLARLLVADSLDEAPTRGRRAPPGIAKLIAFLTVNR
jgi:hypothetical protein